MGVREREGGGTLVVVEELGEEREERCSVDCSRARGTGVASDTESIVGAGERASRWWSSSEGPATARSVRARLTGCESGWLEAV